MDANEKRQYISIIQVKGEGENIYLAKKNALENFKEGKFEDKDNTSTRKDKKVLLLKNRETNVMKKKIITSTRIPLPWNEEIIQESIDNILESHRFYVEQKV